MIKASPTSHAWVGDHLQTYLEDGASAHLIDLTPIGGRADTPTLLLRTTGRKSGRTLLSPLIYGEAGPEKVLIGSKGGAPQHPAWYLNLTAASTAEYKLADDCWRAAVRVVEGSERERLWEMMVALYPPFASYQAATARRIPVVALDPLERIDRLTP